MPVEGGYPILSVFNGYKPKSLRGEGTSDDPYLLQTAEELGTVCYNPDASYQLAADINLTDITWSMAVIPSFSGRIDGGGYEIVGMNISGGGHCGLIGYLFEKAMVLNLGLVDVNCHGIGDCVGALAGYNDGCSFFSCYSRGSVSGEGNVGGLIGHNRGTLLSCYSEGSLYGTKGWIGGLVGFNERGRLSFCYSTGSSCGEGSSVGGLVGYNSGGQVLSCFSLERMSGKSYVGGLVGTNDYGSILNCYSMGSVNGEDKIGGLVGYTNTLVFFCYSTGLVSATTMGGGLIGRGVNCLSSFWDIDTSGWTTSSGGIGLNTSEMQKTKPFLDAGWDFVNETINGTDDIWRIDEGKDYPRLGWE